MQISPRNREEDNNTQDQLQLNFLLFQDGWKIHGDATYFLILHKRRFKGGIGFSALSLECASEAQIFLLSSKKTLGWRRRCWVWRPGLWWNLISLLFFSTANMYAKHRDGKVVTQVREGCVIAAVKVHSGSNKSSANYSCS